MSIELYLEIQPKVSTMVLPFAAQIPNEYVDSAFIADYA